MARRPSKLRWVGLGLGALAVAALGWGIWQGQQLPEGPSPIAWDKVACAHCHMHVGDPAFAAQLQLNDGQVLDFDDPGCLLQYLPRVKPEDIHAVWFHQLHGKGWLTREQVAFVPASPTPMGWGLGAVPRGTPGALSLEQALHKTQDVRGPHAEGEVGSGHDS